MLWAVLGSALGGAIIAILGIVTGDLPDFAAQLIGSLANLFIFACLALLCFLMRERNIFPKLMVFAIGACWLSCLMWWFFIWFMSVRSVTADLEKLFFFMGIVSTVAFWAPYVGLMYWLPITKGSLIVLRRVTVGLASCFAGLVIILYLILMTFGSSRTNDLLEIISRLLGVIGFAGFGLTVVTVVLAFVVRVRDKSKRETMSQKFFVKIVCPRCEALNKLSSGIGKCIQCALLMRVEIEEPRCQCGYTIYRLESDRCPECGQSIPAEDRWMPKQTDSIRRAES